VKLVNNPTCLQLYDVQGNNSSASSILGVLGLSSLESISSSLSSKEREVANYLSFWSNFGLTSSSASSQEKQKQIISNSKTTQHRSNTSGSGGSSISGSIRSLLSIVWFGDHSLILLGTRRGNFTLEILSREPLPHSSAPLGGSGEPTSKVIQ
jgi:hypothetical protein